LFSPGTKKLPAHAKSPGTAASGKKPLKGLKLIELHGLGSVHPRGGNEHNPLFFRGAVGKSGEIP